mmetsp:Transcript_8955/g.23058  ORF Transcript_8955/g.23058 Transcript_8955/m.23058 type:complete len:231 (-) Transcript_8955:239-931(-)
MQGVPAQEGRRAPHHRLPDDHGPHEAVQPRGAVRIRALRAGQRQLPLLHGARRPHCWAGQGAQLPGGVPVLQVAGSKGPHHHLQRRVGPGLRAVRHQAWRKDDGAGGSGGRVARGGPGAAHHAHHCEPRQQQVPVAPGAAARCAARQHDAGGGHLAAAAQRPGCERGGCQGAAGVAGRQLVQRRSPGQALQRVHQGRAPRPRHSVRPQLRGRRGSCARGAARAAASGRRG